MATRYVSYQATSLPIAMPGKSQHYQTSSHAGAYAVSPPEVAESVTTGSAVHSAYSSTSSYAGTGEYDSNASASSVDLHEYIQDRFCTAFDPLTLDRSLATQSQASGALNAKNRELNELRAKAQARLAKMRTRFAEGIEDANEVKRDLEWTQKRVAAMKTKASRHLPNEYKKARERYPSPES